MNKILKIIIKLFFATFLLWILVHTSKLNFRLMLNLFYSPVLLSIVFVIYVINIIIGAYRWLILNRAQSISLSFSSCLRLTYVGIAINNLLPGSVGGDFYRYFYVAKTNPGRRIIIMSSVLFDRATGLMGIFIVIAAVALHYKSVLSNDSMYLISSSLFLSIGGLLAFIVIMFLPLHKLPFYSWYTQYLGRTLHKLLSSFIDAVLIYQHSKISILKCLILSVIVQIGIAIACMVTAKILHFPDFNFFGIVLAVAITQIVSLLPATPGGLGIGELAFANIMILLNPFAGMKYATIYLSYRLIGILSYVPGIVLFIFSQNYFRTYHTTHEKII